MATKIIADCCSNHLGSRLLIEAMIKYAAKIGIDYVKFQSFQADNLNKSWPNYEESKNYYKSVELSNNDHAFIISKCEEYNIKPLFTAFNVQAAMLLAELGMKEVKIASPDANNWELISVCMAHFERLFVSTGMINKKQRNELLKFLRQNDVVLYCVSKYPTDQMDIDYDEMFSLDGFSDHTKGIEVAKQAIDFNVGYIERHFTLGNHLPGKDHFLSSTPDEFQELVDHRNHIQKCEQYKTRWRN